MKFDGRLRKALFVLLLVLMANSLYVFQLNTSSLYQNTVCEQYKQTEKCLKTELHDSWIEKAFYKIKAKINETKN